jgi:hypothetical protein
MKSKLITLLTDFDDFYPGVMKGVILNLLPDARIVDIAHSIEPQNVLQGAFLLLNSYSFFPQAIHIAVVDPGVGSKRKALVVECNDHIFIGPDNGILYPACIEAGIERIWRIKEREVAREVGELSKTFHGRDVFAPAAAYAAMEKIKEIAEPHSKIEKLNIFDWRIEDDEITCNVIFIDRFGNAITNLRKDAVEELNPKGFYIDETKFPLVESYSDVGVGMQLAIFGSFNTLELSVRNGNASKKFGIKSGLIKLGVWK